MVIPPGAAELSQMAAVNERWHQMAKLVRSDYLKLLDTSCMVAAKGGWECSGYFGFCGMVCGDVYLVVSPDPESQHNWNTYQCGCFRSQTGGGSSDGV